MSSYMLYDVLYDGIVLSVTSLLSTLMRCIISFYTILLLAHLNKMFGQSADVDDAEELAELTEMMPHGDRNRADVNNMSASSCRKHIVMLEKQLMKLQMLLSSAYKDIAVLRRENETFRLINSQANHMIADFKRKNSHVFCGTTTSTSIVCSKSNASEENKQKVESFPTVSSSGGGGEQESSSENQTIKEQFDEDLVYIKDGDNFIFGKPMYTNQAVTAVNAEESLQFIESLKMTETPGPAVITESEGESKFGAVKKTIENVVTRAEESVATITSLPGKPLTESPSDTDIFLHGSSFAQENSQNRGVTAPLRRDEEYDSGIEVTESSEEEDDETELSSAVFTSSDEDVGSRKRASVLSLEENAKIEATGKREQDHDDALCKAAGMPSVSDLLRKASADRGLITGSDEFKKFLREAALLALSGRSPVVADSMTKLNVFSIWNRQL